MNRYIKKLLNLYSLLEKLVYQFGIDIFQIYIMIINKKIWNK